MKYPLSIIAVFILTCVLIPTQSAALSGLPPIPVQQPNPYLIQTQGLKFHLGLSDGMIHRELTKRGYSDIRITKRKLTKTRAEACKAGIKYTLEIKLDGKVKQKEQTGTCRPVINAQIAKQILRQNRFRNIQITPRDGEFVGIACRRDRRFRIVLNQFGDIQNESILGHCGKPLTLADVTRMLRHKGYSRVKVTSSTQGGRFQAKACKGDARVSMIIGRRGVIRREEQTGQCAPPIHPATIPTVLAAKGFNRIEVTDRQLPRYVARACDGNNLFEIGLNRFGRIMDERKIGRCDPPLTKTSLLAQLKGSGYHSVRIVKAEQKGFVAEVCEEGSSYRLWMTIFGETIKQKHLGECPSLRVNTILKQIKKRGISGAVLYVEGCQKKQHIKYELDQYGFIKNQWIIGRCR